MRRVTSATAVLGEWTWVAQSSSVAATLRRALAGAGGVFSSRTSRSPLTRLFISLAVEVLRATWTSASTAGGRGTRPRPWAVA
jgi:hypothetical protein